MRVIITCSRPQWKRRPWIARRYLMGSKKEIAYLNRFGLAQISIEEEGYYFGIYDEEGFHHVIQQLTDDEQVIHDRIASTAHTFDYNADLMRKAARLHRSETFGGRILKFLRLWKPDPEFLDLADLLEATADWVENPSYAPARPSEKRKTV